MAMAPRAAGPARGGTLGAARPFTERHPDVVQVKAEIAALKRQLAAVHDGEPTSIPARPVSQGARPRTERAAQQVGQFRLLDPAVLAPRPMLPNRTQLVLLGAVLAAGTALFAMLLAERLDTSFHTTEQLRAFSKVPVLAHTPGS